MSCSTCYPAQIIECINELYIFVNIDIDPLTGCVVQITDHHGNVYNLPIDYVDGCFFIDIKKATIYEEYLPISLFNRYSGAFTIEIKNKDTMQNYDIQFCHEDTIYQCIVVDKIMNNNLNIDNYNIGCP
jgi:hypothetical protein